MWLAKLFVHVHRTGTPLSPGIGSAVSAAAERMTSDSSPGDVNSGLLLSFVLEVMIFKKSFLFILSKSDLFQHARF